MDVDKPKNLAGSIILLVDDDQFIIDSLKIALSNVDCQIYSANDGKDALALLAKIPADIVITDMYMPNMSGQELLQEISLKYPDTISMMITSNTDLDLILKAVNGGHIWGYLEKPWDNNQLILALENAITVQKTMVERNFLQRTLDKYKIYQKRNFEGFIGESVPMQLVYKAIEYAAPSNASVFITGSSGTGKEVAANALHNLSKRYDKPLIILNCAAIPSELMESEIFGHVKGAFTGADNSREGAASLANGGTLFLDEIGEMDIILQAKLLRFIQTGTFCKVGSDKYESVDIRFICATNRNPIEAIEQKKIREDLYYRLNVVSIHLPSLHERGGDCLMLAQFFLRHFSDQENKSFIGIAYDAEAEIIAYSWPGNIRQLQNIIHSCVVMSDGPLLTCKSLISAMGNALQHNAAMQPTLIPDPSHIMPPSFVLPQTIDEIRSLAEIEKQTIEHAISVCNGSVVTAASALGLSPSTLYRKINLWQKD